MELLQKYNVAAPRYTSYPTVPLWDSETFSEEQWKHSLQQSFAEKNAGSGISLYLHLPFCESLCTYCGCNKYITVNHGHETPYIDTLLKEWELYLQLFGERPRLREVHLGGGTPTFFSPDNLRMLLTAIFDTCDILPDAAFSFEGHPNNTTAEHMQALYELGFRRMSLGIQDLDPVVQHAINRIQPFETVEKVVKEARSIGYTSINFDLIYGLPFQTQDSIRDTITQVMQLSPERISFYSYAHVPWVKGNGQRLFSEKDLPKDGEKRALYELGRSLLQAYGYEEIGMDHFALPGDELYTAWKAGRLHRNFMGYTVTFTEMLIGLGVSAISDHWQAYVQNEKNLAAYQARVREGRFPVCKGHMLNGEDMLLRKHIQALMCGFRTGWTRRDTDCDAVIEGLQRLREPEQDGLVTVTKAGVTVTEKGKPFIRNICMAFDARLWRSEPAARLFSSSI
ncbi:oxygen-independent coproporphyrinogen III oxidase [Chitinophaga sp. XS-30]|uniref:oxygen-independent coproporphyrinogen III oxidase n=1 Tax=Chitinophaga sp. XS-30 TaxID=2604421 RepID=UPI0011DD4F71|nr:oxygen-independent coproporphyrinogen III oxidase [Chitinophaga sp. XS-30]QEH40997.1 oxygen-independent coproporphyrinogen III oxidase [Chitinophaga sp. XS-30]